MASSGSGGALRRGEQATINDSQERLTVRLALVILRGQFIFEARPSGLLGTVSWDLTHLAGQIRKVLSGDIAGPQHDLEQLSLPIRVVVPQLPAVQIH